MLYVLPVILGLMALWHLTWCVVRGRQLTQFCFWLFVLYFFVIAPAFQIQLRQFPWGASPTVEELLLGQILIVAFCIAYAVGGMPLHLAGQDRSLVSRRPAGTNASLPKANRAVLLLLGVAVIYLGFLAAIGLEVSVLFTTREQFSQFLELASGDAGAGPILLILMALVRVPAVVLVLYAFLLLDRHKVFPQVVKLRWYHMAMIGMVIFVGILPNSPWVAARFWAGSLLAVMLFWAASMLGRRALQFAMIVYGVSVIFVFTLANMFRWEGTKQEIGAPDFSSGHYDAFIQVVNSMHYVSEEGLDFGRQVLGAVLYWVPRTVWPEKPVGTGHLVHEYIGHAFTNVSAPLVAESYVAFGFIGVLIAGGLLGILSRKLEQTRAEGCWPNRPVPVYLASWFFVAYQWILLRGDLMTFFRYLLPFAVLLFFFDPVMRYVGTTRLKPIRLYRL